MSGPTDAMESMAERLEGMVDELTDMAMDALRRATSGDPDSAETGEALAMERRILKARRAVEKAAAALGEESRSARASLDDGAA
ncbi:MAG TPA: hypothetical protein VN886_06660 [Acidimicrobiales bacterium]|nr:hypothetical protein [Acidimicrobiales bacterium]